MGTETRTIATRLDDAPSDTGCRDSKCVVTIQRGDLPYRLFCTHTVAGGVGSYVGLATALGPAYSVFGIRACWISDRRESIRSIESIARHYIHEVRRIQRHGRYLIFGWSSGGLIAYEMARQLIATGEMAAVALGDTGIPAAPDAKDRERDCWRLYAKIAAGRSLPELECDEDNFWHLPHDRRLDFVLTAAQHHGHRSFLAHLAATRCPHATYFEFFADLWRATRRYRPYACAVPLIFIEAADTADPYAATRWSHLTGGPFLRVTIPGDHVTIMRPPALAALATELRQWMSRFPS